MDERDGGAVVEVGHAAGNLDRPVDQHVRSAEEGYFSNEGKIEF